MPDNTLLGDPLRESTRKSRRTLVAVSFVSSMMAVFDIAPSQITLFGSQLPLIPKPALWVVFALVAVFFLVEFCTYAAPDLVAMKRALNEFKAAAWEADVGVVMHGENPEPEYPDDLRRKSYNLLRRWSKWLAWLRMFVDFYLPALLGVAAIAILVVFAVRAH